MPSTTLCFPGLLLGLVAFTAVGSLDLAHAANAVVRAGMTWQVPRTTGPFGYGNHGRFDGTNGAHLDQEDRRNANWDRAPGFFAELAWEELATAGVSPELDVGLEAYSRLTTMDTEFNETQHNWWFLTQTAGLRTTASFPRFPWLRFVAGAGAGGGAVAREGVLLWEFDYGVHLGPVRLMRASQMLSGGRQVDHTLTSFTFDVGEAASTDRQASRWEVRVLHRIKEQPGRDVKTMHKTGVGLAYLFHDRGGECPLLIEAEASLAPVESEHRRPLNENTPNNYRTQDEVFYALSLGRRHCVATVANLYLDLRLGAEAYHEDDRRVNTDGETGWTVGAKGKVGLWRRDNRIVGYGVDLVAGYDRFGHSFGIEISLSSRL